MSTNNSIDSGFTNNSDGFDISGGATQRKLTLTAGDLTLSSGGANTYTFPSATDTLVGRASTDTLTNKTLTATSNSVGVQTFTNPYKFSAYSSTTTSVNGFTKIVLNTKEYDTSANFDSTTNYRFTAPIAGFYRFYGSAEFNATAANQQYTVSLYKNGSEFKRGNDVKSSTTGILQVTVSPPLFQLAASDYIELWGFSGSGAITVSAGPIITYFGGELASIA